MKLKSINTHAELLAEEISTRSIYKVEEIKTLIAMRFNDALKEFIKERATESEKEYYNLLKQQANNKIGSTQYVSMGYKLAAAKHKKTESNRILNEINQDDKYIRLKKFVAAKFGQDVIDEFIKEVIDEKVEQNTPSN